MDEKNGIPSFPDNYFDLAIVDPQYGINQNGGKNKTRNRLSKATDYMPFAGGDKEPPPVEYFKQLIRVSKNQIIWGANHFVDRIGLPSSCWIVWDKMNGNSMFADCELAYTSFKTKVRKVDYRWNGMMQADMKHKEKRIHPTQKPVALYCWLLENYAKPGDLILDTHVGSASSLIACESMGFNYVGYELSEFYFNAAVNRISKGVQSKIFNHANP